MYVFDDHYHKLNQILLRLFGLWPYEKTKFAHFRATCIHILLIINTIIQLAQLFIVDFDMNVIIRILSDALPTVICIVMFDMFFFYTEKLKQMMKHIITSRRMLTDEQEVKIAEHYAHQGKYITLVFAILLLIFLGFIFFIMGLLPDILDFFRPLNESRTPYLLFMNEYHVDQGIQYYFFFFYVIINIIIGGGSALGVGTMVLLIILHCCAIFKICSYRIEHSVDKKIIMSNKKNIMIKRIIRTVELHENAQKLSKLLISSFAVPFLIILVTGLCSLTISLFRLLHAITCMDNLIEFMIAVAFVIAHECYLFIASFFGQQISDAADEFFNAIYLSLWYEAPVTVQKLLLFIMIISSKGIKMDLGGVYVSIMKSFSSVTNTAISFMMVLYSVQ